MEAPKTLLEAVKYFSDEQVCIDAVAFMRWPNGVVCPHCSGDPEKAAPYYMKSVKRWKCRACREQFSVKVASIFEDSPISLTKWLPAMWLLVNNKNGISSHELGRALGVSQKAAWFMLGRLRLALKLDPTYQFGQSGYPVEVDETFVGGNLKNMHKDRKLRYTKKGGAFGKTIVMGMLDRHSRQVRAKVVPDVTRKTLQAEILKNIVPVGTVYTDGHVGYDDLEAKNYIHETVNHMEEYVRGKVHTQGIENFWSLLKRGLNGTYVAVEPYHMDRYIDEQLFRYNNRYSKDNPLDDADRFLLALSQVANKRLTFKELTGKVGVRKDA